MAAAYVKRWTATHQRNVLAALALARRQLNRLEAAHATVTPTTPTGSKNAKAPAPKQTSGSSVIQTAQLSTKINQLEAQLGIVGVRQVKLAKPRASTLVAPHPRKNAEFAFVIALVLGAFAAFFLGRFNRRLRTLGDIEAALHQEVLTSLPKVRTPVVRRDGWMSPSRHLVEPLRRLQTTLMLEHLPGENRHSSPRSILFVSAEPGDGKSTVAADLALVHSEGGEQVMLIEADFRRPVQARALNIEPDRGLSDVLTGRLALVDALQVVHSAAGQFASPPRPTGRWRPRSCPRAPVPSGLWPPVRPCRIPPRSWPAQRWQIWSARRPRITIAC